jgi:hypothetical protein
MVDQVQAEWVAGGLVGGIFLIYLLHHILGARRRPRLLASLKDDYRKEDIADMLQTVVRGTAVHWYAYGFIGALLIIWLTRRT